MEKYPEITPKFIKMRIFDQLLDELIHGENALMFITELIFCSMVEPIHANIFISRNARLWLFQHCRGLTNEHPPKILQKYTIPSQFSIFGTVNKNQQIRNIKKLKLDEKLTF